jgi:protein-S-isoprenylcysteine O-methyltransferase Ste14
MFARARPILSLVGLLTAYLGIALRLARELAAGGEAVHRMRALAIGLLLLWLLLEAPLALRTSREAARGDDRGTLALNGLARGLALVAALALPPLWRDWNLVQTGALALFVAGFGLRLAAIRALGRFYSHRVRRTDGHQVIDSGPYRLVRHPAYLGVIAAHLGFALVFSNPYALLAVLLLVIPAFVRRIAVEEPVLMKIPGYPEYAAGRARLLPGLW